MTDQTPQTPETTTTTETPWHGEFSAETPQEFKDWVGNKNFPGAQDALLSQYNLERLMGADKAGRTVVLPKDENDVDGRAAFNAKIGVPTSADAYELPMPKGDESGEFAKTASTWFHKHGVPKAAAQGIATEWNSFIEAQIAESDKAAQAKSEQELSSLKGEWGAEFDKNSEYGRRGLKAYGEKAGLDEHDLTALEQSIGTAKMLKLFQEIGMSTAESEFAAGEGSQSFSMTPSQAKVKMDELREKRIKGEVGDKDYMEQMDRLAPIAAKVKAA